jgi:predicted membrane protein DUF2207
MATSAWQPAHLHGMQPVAVGMFVLAGVLIAFVVAKSRREVGAIAPRGGVESSALREEPPAVANLLIHSTQTTRAAYMATLLDLVQRKMAEVIESPGGGFALRLKQDAPSHLSTLERVALDALRTQPAGGDTITMRRAFPWYRRVAFYRAVMDDAVGRGLAVKQQTILPERAGQLAALAAAVGLWLFGLSIGNAVLIAALGVTAFWAPFVLVSLGRRGVLTRAGREAADQWLGVRKYLLNDGQLQDAPPTAIVVWGPYLAYAVALGATDLDFGIAPRAVAAVSRGASREDAKS